MVKPTIYGLALCALVGNGAAAALSPRIVDAAADDFATAARSVAVGEALVVDGLMLDLATPGGDGLELERFEVWSRDSRVVVHRPDRVDSLAPPAHAYFGGHLAGDPTTRVVLTLDVDGSMRGVVYGGRGAWLLREGVPGGLVAEAVDRELALAGRSFDCGTDALGSVPDDVASVMAAADSASKAAQGSQHYDVPVAIDTDAEYLNLFGDDEQLAASYAGDLMAFASVVYWAETGTRLVIPQLELWDVATSADPWTETGACLLLQFGKYWNDNHTGVSRATAHFLSGRSPTAGIAWVGVLCRGPSTITQAQAGANCPSLPNPSNFGGAYGVTGGISGSFGSGGTDIIWDTVATSHELGHNFNSPHTHCYGGLGGSGSPVDACYGGQCGGSGCHCGGTSLPSGCPGSSQRCGTLMSYCHLLSGGFGNVAFTLGRPGGLADHPYGTLPGRVPDRMRSHIESVGCLPLSAAEIFSNGFESGNTGLWSLTVP